MSLDRSAYRRLIRKHKGNLSAIARELGLKRQALTGRLEDYPKLLEDAARARQAARVSGPRRNVSPDPERLASERARILAACVDTACYREARETLHMSRSTFFRALELHGITFSEVVTARARRAAVC